MNCFLRPLLWSAILLTLPGAGFARTWTDVTGTYRIDAEFVDVVEGKVQLKRADGAVIAVPLEKLSDQDRDHIKRILAESLKSAPQASQPAGPPASAGTANEKPATGQPAAEKPPAEKPPARTGQFQISLSEHSPLAARTALFPRMVQPRDLNPAAMEYQQQLGLAFNSEFFYEPDKETCQVYVPDDYDGTVPYGLFVFINSSDSGSPQGNWLPVLKKHRLIYIGPDKAGNEQDVLLRRAPLALDSVHNMGRQYAIDPARVYISGNSGGGRLASRVAMAFPDVFTGGQYHVGADDHRTTAVGNAASSKLAAARNLGRYVFITGDDDMNRAEMQGHANRMLAGGFRFVTYLQIPNHGHSGPPGDWFEKGILALDAPLREAAQAQYEAAQKALERQQWDRALLPLQAAAAHGHDQPFAPEALKALQEIQARYNTDVAAVERLLAEDNLAEANKQLAEFRKAWPQAGRNDAKRLGGAIQKARRTQ